MWNEYRRAMDRLQLSPERDARIRALLASAGPDQQEVLSMKNRRKKLSGLVLAAVVAVCLLAGTALAVALYEDFFNAAFGSSIPTQESYDPLFEQEDGIPAMIRTDADTQLAQELIGAYVCTVNQSIEIGGYSFTVREAVLDDNGIGVITIDVVYPNGAEPKFGYDLSAGEFSPYGFTIRQGNKTCFHSGYGYIDSRVTDNTCVRWVYYFITPDSSRREELCVDIGVWTGETEISEGYDGTTLPVPIYTHKTLTLPAIDPVPAASLRSEVLSASLSPFGLTLCCTEYHGDFDFVFEEIVLVFDDGSEYTVLNDEQFTFSADSARNNSSVCFALNRLTEVEKVTEVRARGFWYSPSPPGSDASEPVTFDTVLTR